MGCLANDQVFLGRILKLGLAVISRLLQSLSLLLYFFFFSKVCRLHIKASRIILLEKCPERRDVWACFDRGRGFCLLINKEIETFKPVLLKDIKNHFEVPAPLLRCILWWLIEHRGIISTTFTARDKMPTDVSPDNLPSPSTPVENQESTRA